MPGGGVGPRLAEEQEFYYVHGRTAYSDDELDDWIDAGAPSANNWNGNKYRGDKPRPAVERVSNGDENYKCQICGNEKHIDDHKRHTASWCKSNECDQIRNHEKL